MSDDAITRVADWAAIRLAAIADLQRQKTLALVNGRAEIETVERRLETARLWPEGMPPLGARDIVVRSVEIQADPDGETPVIDVEPEHEIKISIDGSRVISNIDDRPFTAIITIERGRIL